MYIGIVFTWTICLIHFNPKLYDALDPINSFFIKAVYLIFIMFLNLFWLYGIYHIFLITYRYLSKQRYHPTKATYFPGIAILYTTKNDFQEKAALSCLLQNYPDFGVYILDDSTDDGYKRLIDQFHNLHPNKTTVIRRNEKVGFKAGNLNNALKHYATGYKYFAVIDADEVIPSDFLNELIPYFLINDRIAFVQANHGQNPKQPSTFAHDLAEGINFHWDVYQPPRNDYGFVVFYGHGAIIRRDVWEEVGGFPQIVSEDLAFSTRIRQLGYSGYFVKEVVCYEDFPETYHQFRKRHEKWVKGACEYFHREFSSFVLSRNVTLSEKLDVLFSCFSLFIPAAFLIYIFLANVLLPILLAEKHTISVSLFGRQFEFMSGYFMEPLFRKLWTFDFYIITLVGMFAPILCYLEKMLTHPKKILKLLLKSAVPYISLILVSTCGILTYFFTKRAVFLSTGDKASNDLPLDSKVTLMERLHANHFLIFYFEWILGIIFTYFAIKTMNFGLLTISLCLLISPLISRYGWNNRAVSTLVSLPLFFVLLTFGSIGMGYLGMQGFSLCLLTMHF